MNKIVWVTGTGSGLGKALARELVLLGFDVVGFLRPDPSQDSSKEDPLYETVHLDLSNIPPFYRFLRERLSGSIPPWLVIHNASVLPARKPVWEESWEEITGSFSVNVETPLFVFKPDLTPPD